MKVVLLCGGTGTRLKEQTEFVPKPMVPIGGKPLIWHIMKNYAHHGLNEFVLALGYKQEAFKEYFSHYYQINNDITLHTGMYQGVSYGTERGDEWTVTLSDTGLNTLKGGRLKRIQRYVDGDSFFLSYGDGLSTIDFTDLYLFHERHNATVTVVGVHPPGRFGEIHRTGDMVSSFTEKPAVHTGSCLINAGFYVCSAKIFDCLTTDEWCDFEHGPLELIANKGEMAVYHHKGFWGCCDTLNDMINLNKAWEKGEAAWKIW